MVKGVNKTVIEINDTGSNIFEKVILFVTPKYSNLSAKRLKTEAKRVVNNYSSAGKIPTARQRYKRKRFAALLISFLLIAVVTVAIILLCR